MVTLRKKGSVSYKEPTQLEGLEAGSDDEREEQEEARPAQDLRSPVAKPRARKRPAAAAPTSGADETTLLDIVKKHGASVAVAAKDWADRYREARGAATAELLTFLLQACGVDRVLSEEEVEEGEVDALKEELDKQAQEEGLEDHWRGAKAAARAFRSNYLELWDKVIREMHQADVLWDQFLLDRLSSLLVALNTSVVREFRFVATLTAAQLVTSWIHSSLTLGEARDTAERQLAAEEKKKGRNAQRVDDFRRTRDRCHARIQELKSCIDSLFQGIFAHRFRDCSEEIRATVIQGIGGWVAAHPAAFLTDQYLKYVAWALSDKDPGVRLASVSALLALYSNPDNRAALADFTQRFAQRFGELFYDVDERVAVKGVQLNTLLVRLKEAQPGQFARVYELLADESAAVRHAVAELVACALEEQGRQLLQAAAAPQSAGKRAAARRRSGEGVEASGVELQLAGLLQVLHLLANPPREGGQGVEGEEEEAEAVPLEREVVAQVVDALQDRVPALSDWPLMLSWAQQGKAREHFGEAGLTDLLHLLRLALRKATGGALVPGAGAVAPGGQRGRERKEQQEHARQDATLALMKELPALLRRVQGDPVQSAALVGVVGEMKLEVYSLKRQEKAFSQLAGVVKATFLKHVDAEVARECVAALAACAAAGPDSIKDAAAAALDECAADVVSGLVSAVGALERAGVAQLRAAAAAYERSGGEEEAQLLFDVRAPLARLLALLQLGGGGAAEDDEVHGALSTLLELAASGGPLPAAVAAPAMRAQLLLLLWRLRALDGEFVDAAALQALARQRDEYMAQLESILGGTGSDVLQDEAVSAMTDMLMVFSAAKLEGGPLEAAGLSPSDDALAAWWDRCRHIMRCQAEADEGDDVASMAARMACQRAAAVQAAQLAVFRAVPQHAWLAAQLLSQWVGPEAAVSDGAVRRWAPVAEVVKEAARLLKKSDPEDMPAIYLAALQAAYKSMVDDPLAPPEGDDEPLPAEQEFLALSDRIAKTYAGFNASASAVEHILVEGTRYAVSEGPAHLAFLEGVAFFVRSLPARSAAAVRQRVEAAAAAQGPSPDDPEWETFFLFLDLLDKRAAKGRIKSAMKRGEADAGAGAGAGTAAAAADTARKAPRKISFAARRDAIEESEEEGEDERDAIEEADDDRPSSLVRALPRSSQRDARGGSGSMRRGGRLSGMTPAGGRSAGRRRAAAAAEESEEEEEAVPSRRRQRAFAAAAAEQGQQGADGWEEEEEDEGAEEPAEGEEEFEVMPTEEALAIPHSGGGGRARGRQPRLRSLFEGEQHEQHEQQGQAQPEEEDDDEDLRVPAYGGRPPRGGSQRAAPVVDPSPQLAAAGEESEEEERPARRRRR